MSRSLRSLLLPALILGAVALGLATDVAFLQRQGVLLLTARTIFGLAFLLGWRFRRGQGALAALALAAVTELSHGLLSSQEPPPAALGAVAVLLPLNLAALAWLGEISLLSRKGLGAFLLLAAQAALVTPGGLEWIRQLTTVEGQEGSWMLALAEGRWTLAAFIAVAVPLLLRVFLRPGPLNAGWLGILTAAYLGLDSPDGLPYLGAAGLILLVALVEQAFSLAFHDGLTGLPGRRALDERLAGLSGPYALAMVDLDHFKSVNDRHGHDVGDQVLRFVARRLQSVGGGGLPFRFGGEEFTILFPGTSREEAKPHLEELRQSIAGEPFALRAPDRPQRKPKKGKGSTKKAVGRTLKVTVSIGLAERGLRARPAEEVLQAADKALYRAKRAGRNRLAATSR